MTDLSEARALASLLLNDPKSSEPPQLLQGVIAGPDLHSTLSGQEKGTVTVYISGGSDFPVGNVRVFEHYKPKANDTVWLVKNGPDLMVLGKLKAKTTAIEPFHIVGAAGEPAFQNGWVNFGAAYGEVSFYKDPDGWVHLKGVASAGTNQSVIFTLPVGYRPPVIYDSHQLADNSAGQLQILTDGTVKLWNNGTNGFASLDGVSFPTDEAMNDNGWQTVPAQWVGTTWYERSDADLTKFYIRDDGLVQMTGTGRADSAPVNRILVVPEKARIAKNRNGLFSVCGHNGSVYINVRGDLYASASLQCDYAGGAASCVVFIFGSMRWWNAEAEPGWISPALQNLWVPYGGQFSPPGYRKDKYGRVHIRGLIKNGTTTNGTTLFTLPVGYRPEAGRRGIFPAETGGSGNQARIDVLPDGTVICQLASNGFLSLDNISFRAEQ